jgi:hypothetical protein
LYVKESCGYKKERKNGQVSKVKKKRREEKIAHVFLQLLSSSKERNFQGA